ncbi:MAG TPA: zf-HC2 domain-containing protein [Gaiellaceae bacterium]|nr:zf-HC2 domain-containing protein [Gaiellaceae bacterium]
MTSAACDRARAWVSLDLDGGLSTFEKRLLDRHLDACGECHAFADDAALLTLQLRAAPLEPAHVTVALPRRGGSLVSSALAGVGAAAAVAAAAVLAFGAHSGSRTPRVTSSGQLASGLAVLTTNADALGVPQHELPKASPRIVTSVRGTFGIPV